MNLILAEQRRRRIEAERADLDQSIAAVRQRCSTLAGFVREAWPVLEPDTTYVHGWHIDTICTHLEAITWGYFLAKGLSNRLLINVPPGTMKSLLCSVFWQAWEWGPAGMPYLRYVNTSYTDEYVKRDSRRTRDLIRSDWYQAHWGDTVTLERTGEASFSNTARGDRTGIPFGSLTGGRGDRVIIDDPHSTEGAESEAERQRTTRIFRESVPLRLNSPKKSAIVVIMQRLHANDVSGVIQDMQLGYVHVCLPMEFEPERACITPFGADPRTTEGELLFPEQYPREVVERDKIPLGSYGVAGQFQQRPSPREGGLFKRHWLGVRDAAPAGTKWCRGWDLAATKSTSAAFTAGVLMGVTPAGEYCIADVERLRGTSGEVEVAIKNTASKDGDDVLISLPQDPGQAGKAQVKYYAKQLAGYRFRATPESGDKVSRADAMASQAEAGNVFLLRGSWNEAFIDEMSEFPGGKYKDQVDAASRAFHECVRLRGSASDEVGAPVQVGAGSRERI